MKYTTKLLFVVSTLASGVLHRTVTAATTAKLSVSAIVETRCLIKVSPIKNQQAGDIKSDCSDNTAATITVARPTPASAVPPTPQRTVNGIGSAEITVTY